MRLNPEPSITSRSFSQSYVSFQQVIVLIEVFILFFLVDAKAEIADLQTQMKSLKERNAVLEKTNQNVRCVFELYSY